MKVRYLESARDDIVWFRAYYSRVFPAGNSAARIQLNRSLQLLKENPKAGRLADGFTDAFELVLTRTPFSIVYRVKGDELQILRLLDQRDEYSNERRR